MAKKPRGLKASLIAQPANDAEAAAWIAELGVLQRQREAIKQKADDAIAAVTTTAALESAPVSAQLLARLLGLQAYATRHRERLTEGKVKFWRCPTGEVAWRNRPPSISLKGVEAVIAAIKEGGDDFAAFLRTKEEVNKEAMLEDPQRAASIAGVTIKRDVEDFIVRPLESALEEVAP